MCYVIVLGWIDIRFFGRGTHKKISYTGCPKKTHFQTFHLYQHSGYKSINRWINGGRNLPSLGTLVTGMLAKVESLKVRFLGHPIHTTSSVQKAAKAATDRSRG